MIRNVYPFGDGVTGKTYGGLTVITATSCFQTKSICTLHKTPNSSNNSYWVQDWKIGSI